MKGRGVRGGERRLRGDLPREKIYLEPPRQQFMDPSLQFIQTLK